MVGVRYALKQRAARIARRVTAADYRHISPAVCASYGSTRCHQDHAGAGNGLEAEHRTHAPFDGTVILLDTVVEVLTLPDPDRLEPTR
jgi:hypothetical protein